MQVQVRWGSASIHVRSQGCDAMRLDVQIREDAHKRTWEWVTVHNISEAERKGTEVLINYVLRTVITLQLQ